MARNKINDLRDHLFETLEALKDPDKPMETERARAISEVAQTIINSAKVEIELVKAVSGSTGSRFFQLQEESRELPKIAARGARDIRREPGRIAERSVSSVTPPPVLDEPATTRSGPAAFLKDAAR
ncbi:MAG TPA: hypothetical protein VN841_02515 [Bryobacteraceae bacterium]|nr:hypothetical protein [Bryobacteraceae bacterium]